MFHIFELYWLSQVVLSKQLANDQFQQGTLICLGSYRKLNFPPTKPHQQVYFGAARMYALIYNVVYFKL